MGLNTATMIVAVQEYLDRRTIGTLAKVTNVEHVSGGLAGCGNSFRVTLAAVSAEDDEDGGGA